MIANRRRTPVLIAVVILAAACGDDSTTTGSVDTTSVAVSSTTAEQVTTTTNPAFEIAFGYSYSGPDGNVDDLLDNFPASPPDPANGNIGLFSAHGVLEYTGAFAGEGAYVMGSTEHPTGMAAGGIIAAFLIQFRGTVEGCGDGTLVLAEQVIYPAEADGEGTWRVLPGYGSGDLAAVEGFGTSRHSDSLDSGSGDLSGTISCTGEGVAAPQPPAEGDQPVTFAWTYGDGDNTYDPAAPTSTGSDAVDVAETSLMHGHGTLSFSETLRGRRVWISTGHPLGWTTIAGTRLDVINVRGGGLCGEGSFLLLGAASFGPGTETPLDMLDSEYTWEIVPGFGTGAFASAIGSGTGTTQENATSGSATLTGTISCG